MPVHSPLLKQSQLLAVPPLSDMLKLSGSFPVHQVTNPSAGPPQGEEATPMAMRHAACDCVGPSWGRARHPGGFRTTATFQRQAGSTRSDLPQWSTPPQPTRPPEGRVGGGGSTVPQQCLQVAQANPHHCSTHHSGQPRSRGGCVTLMRLQH